MPGYFPGRPGGEHDEPLLDMILERRPIPPGAPPEIHGLDHVLAALTGPAEPGELTGEAAALAAFARRGSPASISPAAPRSARRSVPEWRARGKLRLAAALTAAAVGLGGTAAAYAGVLPGPIQHFAHQIIGAPAPHHDLSGPAPAIASSPARAHRGAVASAPPESHKPPSPVPHRGHDRPGDRSHGKPAYPPGHNPASCYSTAAGTQSQAQNHGNNQNQNQSRPSPTPAQETQDPGQDQGQSKASPSLKPTAQASMAPSVSAPRAACPTAGPATQSPSG